jgi:chromosome segregation ATPase
MSSHPALGNGATIAPSTSGIGNNFNLDLGSDDSLREEMKRLAAINKELLQKVRPAPPAPRKPPQEIGELALLRKENAELLVRVGELEQVLSTEGQDAWADRQKEFENLLEEKTEVIRNLHRKIQEGETRQHDQPGSKHPGSKHPAQELAGLQQQMEEQRRQLAEDEEALMAQMRQMEMAMSRERAELARQRSEIQRLHAELTHEIELASRDPSLRERLFSLQRRQQAIAMGKPAVAPQTESPEPPPKQAPPPAKNQSSGLLRRIFGK